MAQNPHLAALAAAGVSIWLDDLSRERLKSGNLKELIDTRSVVGVTTNPSIFQAALSKGTAYDAQVAELAERGADVDATIRTVTTDDVREMALPVMRHRIITTFNAEAAGITADEVVLRLLAEVRPGMEETLA